MWAAEIRSDSEMFVRWYHSVITRSAWRAEEGVRRTATQIALHAVHISCILPAKAKEKSHFRELTFFAIWLKTKPSALNIYPGVCVCTPSSAYCVLAGFCTIVQTSLYSIILKDAGNVNWLKDKAANFATYPTWILLKIWLGGIPACRSNQRFRDYLALRLSWMRFAVCWERWHCWQGLLWTIRHTYRNINSCINAGMFV